MSWFTPNRPDADRSISGLGDTLRNNDAVKRRICFGVPVGRNGGAGPAEPGHDIRETTVAAEMTPSGKQRAATRIWRVRRRGDAIDASIDPAGKMWRLQLTRKGRLLGEWNFDTREKALAAGLARRQEFERAGWTEHW